MIFNNKQRTQHEEKGRATWDVMVNRVGRVGGVEELAEMCGKKYLGFPDLWTHFRDSTCR